METVIALQSPLFRSRVETVSLPKTGDAGTTLLAAGGITLAVLSAAAVALLLVFKKKDKFDD